MKKENFGLILMIVLFNIMCFYNICSIIVWLIFFNLPFIFLHSCSLIIFLFNIRLFLKRMNESKEITEKRKNMTMKEKSFIGFIQYSIYTIIFFCLIIWLRITEANFDFSVLSGFITGILFTIALCHLAVYSKEKEKENEK